MNLVLLRHGQSLWNLENKFTGWTDVPLTEKGILEANVQCPPQSRVHRGTLMGGLGIERCCCGV